MFEIPLLSPDIYGPPIVTGLDYTLVGGHPVGKPFIDSAGNLIFTAQGGAGSGVGSVIEMIRTGGTYGPPVILFGFGGSNGAFPNANLIADASGNLYGTTGLGGSAGIGTVFEIVKTGGTYANNPTTLFSFDGVNTGWQPTATLLADASGNLFGTARQGGTSNGGTVFKLANGASTPTVLVNFNTTIGTSPQGTLIADANGDLFGTTSTGGPGGSGTVFELVKTGSSYSLTTLAAFNGANGAGPLGGLLLDAKGDLFGTTASGGPGGFGTVFELIKTGASYTLSTLVSFNGSNGGLPAYVDLIADARGNLFGTTAQGGPGGQGTAFEITNSGFVPFGPTGFAFTADLTKMENGNHGLRVNAPIGTFTQVGGVQADNYTFSLGGPDASAFTMQSVSNTGILSSGGGDEDSGGNKAGLYELTIQVTDTTTGTTAGPLPFDIVVDNKGGNTINTTSLGIAAATPTFIHAFGGDDDVNASGLTGPAWIAGGGGADTMTGGSGTNTYVYGATAESRPGHFDIITNFNTSRDVIDLNGLGFTPLTFQAAHLAGTGPIAAHTIAWQNNGGNTFIYVNTSGGNETKATSNMVIEWQGNLTPMGSNFLHH